MSTASNDDHWLKLITQCRSSGLTDRQWCIENGISVSTFYYHVRALIIPEGFEPPVRILRATIPGIGS